MNKPIELKHIYKAFGTETVLSDVNLSFEPGNCYAVTGASGSGKTTLLRIILGLEKPDSGEKTPQGLLHAGVVFQEDRLTDSLSAVGCITAAIRGMSADVARHELACLLEPELCDKRVSELSGGEKRRVAVVRACSMKDSGLLVMDEPFTGMDGEAARLTAEYIMKVRDGRTLIITAHDIDNLIKLGIHTCEVRV